MYWSAASTHKDKVNFEDVTRFDPSRFEGAGPTPYTYVPFGGGPRMCLGKEFSRVEILAFLHNIVTNFKWDLLIPDEKIEYDPMATPVKGLIFVSIHIILINRNIISANYRDFTSYTNYTTQVYHHNHRFQMEVVHSWSTSEVGVNNSGYNGHEGGSKIVMLIFNVCMCEGKKEVKVFQIVKLYAFELACCLFMSLEEPNHITKLGSLFNIFLKGILELPINFPGTRFYSANKAAAAIRKELMMIIKARRVELEEGKASSSQDLLSHLLTSSDENGRYLTEKDIANNILLLLFAGHDTSTVAITLLIKSLGEHPDVYNKVLNEQLEISKAKEMYWSAASTHKDKANFEDVTRFDPSRFEGAGPTPYTYVPFGGGPRMCLGKEFSRVEILAFLHNIVTNFKWDMLIPDEKIEYDPMATPVKGLPIHLYPHHFD
ncbi:hypothetical protein M8C21_011642 [Ambrosia artemisiifolia]|uniref:Cytochrome P450 n=1 Tax=Ambrosia artemisiifolia TaxID=4212 RepID=A0AAD5GUS3_AMBAR|nr:hypothetical protein M8C21_011642 [Ambrosia artemisiifolia]